MEMEENNDWPFLDVLVMRQQDRLNHKVYRNPTHTHRSERRRQLEAKHGARKNPPTSAAGSSGTQGTGVVSTQSEAQPSTSGQSSQKGKRLYSQRTSEEAARATKRTRTELGTMGPPESFADKVTVEKMAIIHLNHPKTKLSKETALKIKMELGRRAIRGKDVRITSCRPENGAVVVGCGHTYTKSWLETQFKQLDPFEGIQLRLGPARSLVRMCKFTTFVPRTTGAETKDDVMLGLKSQSGLDTDHWAVGCNTTPEGQLLVIHVDGRRRSSYLEFVQKEGRQTKAVWKILQSVDINKADSFADDSPLHAGIMSKRPISVVELERRRLATAASLSKDLETITAWRYKNMVEFNADKTQYCTLSNKRYPSEHSVLMSSQALPRSISFKLLGVQQLLEKSSDIYSEPSSNSRHPTFSRYI
nr:unnamed protein product [Callosobruchus chinensis]